MRTTTMDSAEAYISAMVDEILAKEGGYCNHPNDRGGPTCWGVTEQVARANGYTGDLKDLPKERAKVIYREQYFVSPGFSRVAEISAEVAAELADTGVNMGPQVAAKMLQRALNALNREAKDYPDVVVDGWIGNGTLAALGQFIKVRGQQGEQVMMKALNCLQGVRYLEIAENNKSQESFVYGWLAGRVAL